MVNFLKRIGFFIQRNGEFEKKFIGYTEWRYCIYKDKYDENPVRGTSYAIGFYLFYIGISIDEKDN